VIVGAAFVPGTPLVVPEIARGAAGEVADALDAARTAIRRVGSPASRWLVLGGADEPGRHVAGAVGSFAGFGVALEVCLGRPSPGTPSPSPTLPLALTVGAWLLQDALGPMDGVEAVAVTRTGDAAVAASAGDVPTALLVVGDGSARRTEKAPGHLDPRAEAFDATVAAALGSGVVQRLEDASSDLDLARDLLAAGAVTWHEAAGLLEGGSYAADVLYDAAPFGVGYFVAAWTARA
jgi:hypothetical protein